jgi:signal peptidase II
MPKLIQENASLVQNQPRPLMLVWFSVAALILIADQVTKSWIDSEFFLGQSEIVTSFFNLVRVHNYGAAFSFLSDAGGWQRWFLASLSSVISVVLVIWLIKLPRSKWIEGLALALILGGALGNLYDRVILGYVVDFLDFHWSGSHFPAFNVADSGITAGAILLVLDIFSSQQD